MESGLARTRWLQPSGLRPACLPHLLGIVYCVQADTGKLVYEERLSNAGQFYGSPVLVNDKLYAISRRGVGFVLAAKAQFEQLARNELGDRSSFDASPAVDGDRLLVRSDKFLYCLGAP